MTKQDVRKLIGNTPCIIVFKEDKKPLNPEIMVQLGKVNKFFVVVEKSGTFFSFGVNFGGFFSGFLAGCAKSSEVLV